jgi:YVTN family beta-propeller protein
MYRTRRSSIDHRSGARARPEVRRRTPTLRTAGLAVLAASPLFGFMACSSSSGGSSSTAGTGGAHAGGPVAMHSSSIAVTPDGTTLYVVNADADSVSQIDTKGRKLVREIPLASGPPSVDASGHYTPAVGPRALALSPQAGVLYVTGERSSKLYAIDLTTFSVKTSVEVGSEPIGVLVSPDESAVYVACSNDATVVRVDPTSMTVTQTATITEGTSPAGAAIPAEPWALGWSLDASLLYVTHLVAPRVSALDPASLAVKETLTIPDVSPGSDKRLANGQARGLYDVVARPGTSGEVWTSHMMLAVGTPETTDPTTSLDFESTAFPTLSVFDGAGTFVTRMSTNAMAVSSNNGAFGDIVSGPHAVAFTADGSFALMLDGASEDVLAVDANGRVEAQLLRPLYLQDGPQGHMQEGIVISPDGKSAYIDERNTSDVAVIAIDTSNGITLTVDGASIPRLSKDPMPAAMRAGQLLFNTANSDLVPITQNHWIACATCHVEGRSDAVTWKFLEGPRDTPSNAGGVSDTGFLLRTADRSFVSDYWQTIDTEQGGAFGGTVNDDEGIAVPPTDPKILADMQAIQTYVNFAIPVPVPPHTDPTLVAQGQMIFSSAGCPTCHLPTHAYTDSGQGNPTLSLDGPVLLHDVGTCVTTSFPDVAHTDQDGGARAACMFDTPTLRGIASSPPYLHDGSAPTLLDVLVNTKGKMGNTGNLSSGQLEALAEFLRSL